MPKLQTQDDQVSVSPTHRSRELNYSPTPSRTRTTELLAEQSNAPNRASSETPILLQRMGEDAILVRRPKSDHQTNLLSLFRQAPERAGAAAIISPPVSQQAPAELAAQSTPELQDQPSPSNESLIQLLRPKSGGVPRVAQATKPHQGSTSREGHTSATISGPLNQPQFEGMAKASRPSGMSNGMSRSPVPKSRTLYDPSQPAAVKILPRPEEPQRGFTRSPKVPKEVPKPFPSKLAPIAKEAGKAFQPQILRRQEDSQTAKQTEPPKPLMQPKASIPSTDDEVLPETSIQLMGPPLVHRAQESTRKPSPLHHAFDRRTSQDDSHRQALLSLFNKPAPSKSAEGISSSSPPKLPVRLNASPLPSAHIVSPLTDKPAQGNEAVSTRSRVGSMASMVSGSSQTPVEKRQTTAGDRAFLLGYLGRIASQGG